MYFEIFYTHQKFIIRIFISGKSFLKYVKYFPDKNIFYKKESAGEEIVERMKTMEVGKLRKLIRHK